MFLLKIFLMKATIQSIVSNIKKMELKRTINTIIYTLEYSPFGLVDVTSLPFHFPFN